VTIRLKLMGALAPPLATLVIVTALELAGALGEMRLVRQQTELADASIGPLGVLNDLESERDWASVHLLGLEDAVTLEVEDTSRARALTDEAAEQLHAQVRHIDPPLRAGYTRALTRYRDLAETRQQVDAYRGERSLANTALSIQVFDHYSAVEDAFFDANEEVIQAIDDPTVRQGAHLALLSSRQTDLTARIVRDLVVAQVGGPTPDGLNTREEIEGIAALQSRLRGNEDELRAAEEGSFRPHITKLFAADQVTVLPGLADKAIETGSVDLEEVLSATTGSTGESPYTTFRKAVVAELQRHTHHRERQATAEARWLGGITILAAASAVAVSLLVARSITRPLGSLTRQARDMAHHRLPDGVRAVLERPLGEDVQVPVIEPVCVQTRDEITDVAAALTSVQETAMGLAVEHAVLRRNLSDSFLHMGRRNQNLLARQLELITQLESGETDPDALAHLFHLDHLATRMRRNAESLLVLVGTERPRRTTTPVNIRDLVRAALGEVEDYQRITAHSVTPVTVDGAAASDLAHVLAELIENALLHTPPDLGVEMLGVLGGKGYRLAIVDNGLGMTPDDMAAANRRLNGTESFTVAPSRYLGHYVAGHLAAHHDVDVHLQASSLQGVTAVIDIPAALIHHPPTESPWSGRHPVPLARPISRVAHDI
jgi:hypothetical protein